MIGCFRSAEYCITIVKVPQLDMGIFNFLRSTWSACKNKSAAESLKYRPQEECRHLAWEREAAAFDDFATLFQRQVREEPTATPKKFIWPTDWKSHLPEVLHIQELYKEGLRRLKIAGSAEGLHNRIGPLEEAHALASLWHCKLVHGGPKGDMAIEGKYFDALKISIQAFSVCAQKTDQWAE